MRTTITIEEDVARVLMRLRKERNATLKEMINQALRAGFAAMTDARRDQRRARYHTRPVRLGARLPNLDNTAEVLAIAEGEAYR